MSYFKSKITAFVLAAIGLLAFKAETVFALRIDLDRPGPNEFVRDLAGMIFSANEAEIKKLAGAVLKDKASRYWSSLSVQWTPMAGLISV